MTSYEARTIRFPELWQPSGWRLKLYGYRKERPIPDLVAAAKGLLEPLLQKAAEPNYRVGLSACIGREACFATCLFVHIQVPSRPLLRPWRGAAWTACSNELPLSRECSVSRAGGQAALAAG
jgi:hypothetical protein